jgi:hypothetical protein
MAQADLRVVSRTQNQTIKDHGSFRYTAKPNLRHYLTKVGSTLSPEERQLLERD